MNKAVRRIALACLVMFAALLINVDYLQAFQAGSLAGKKGNIRAFDQQYQYQRGSITTADGVTIAASRKVSGIYKYKRYYTDGPVYAPVTGYDSIYGETGVELAANKLLSGTSPALTVRNLISLVTGKPQQGASVETTVNSRVQQAAYQALRASGKSGAVVALNPKTGAILAMASYPSYDTNAYATFNGIQLNKIDKANRDNPGQPLLNRAINDTYPPGSTFKIVTSSTALSTGKVASVNSLVYAPTTLTLPQTSNVLINDNHEACGGGSGQVPLILGFTESCNTVFGALGMKLGNVALHREADSFGLNNPRLTVPMPVTPSRYPFDNAPAYTAYSAIGQYNDAVTPLQEAMFSAAIADHGTLMKPYLIQQVKAPDLSTVQQATATALSHPVSSGVAAEMTAMMRSVVESPYGTAHLTADVPGLGIAGKTGTAQNGINNTNLDDAVFTCFAPYSNPVIAVGVIVKGGGLGAAAAAPIAVQVVRAYLQYLGRT